MRIVALSDIHGFHDRVSIPDGDVFICGGDFSMRAKHHHVVEFARWVNSLPHQHKIVVPGNHDMACECHETWAKEEFSPSVFLKHEFQDVGGLKVFGSAYSSSIYEPSRWCYDYPRYGERGKQLWNSIRNTPEIDVLITHGPPYGFGDLVKSVHKGEDPHVGDQTLLNVVNDLKPKVHIFGHIHEGYGVYSNEHGTQFFNVCVCNVDYEPVNPVTVIDL